MSKTVHAHKQAIRTALLLASVLLLGVIGVLSIKPATTISAASPETSGPARSIQQALGLPPRLIRVFVHEFDLYPNAIKLPPGRIVLRAENEKHMDIALVVERLSPGQSAQQISRIDVAGYLKRVAREISLDVGEYHFYEASNPALKGKIIVKSD